LDRYPALDPDSSLERIPKQFIVWTLLLCGKLRRRRIRIMGKSGLTITAFTKVYRVYRNQGLLPWAEFFTRLPLEIRLKPVVSEKM